MKGMKKSKKGMKSHKMNAEYAPEYGMSKSTTTAAGAEGNPNTGPARGKKRESKMKRGMDYKM